MDLTLEQEYHELREEVTALRAGVNMIEGWKLIVADIQIQMESLL
ncbi:hypothetical protein A2U01_0082546, partial [Trifolium medium]|nr:hypothetical protein [Trifolium medium]